MTRIYHFFHQTILAMSLVFVMSTASLAADCDSVNVPLTSKFRFLGSWTAEGKPLYLEAKRDSVPQSMIDYVNRILPESVNLPNSNDDFFGDDVQLNTELKIKSKVYVTMVQESAGWTNTLGYYTYNIDNPPATVYDIDSLVVLFPNVSLPKVVSPGDKILLGEFPAKTGIGYFLIAQGWVNDTICIPSHIVFTDKRLNTFTTAKYQQQTILLNYEPEEKYLLCFEDIKRPGGDNDFNDAVFYISAAESGAIDTRSIPLVPTAHLSGDTTLCSSADKAKLKVELTGVAPWSIVYSAAGQNITINNITQNTYFIETTVKGVFTMVSVNDKNKAGIPSGTANVIVSKPTATLGDVTSQCGDQSAVVAVNLTGTRPWTVNYKLNDVAASANSNEPLLNLTIDQPGIFQLINVSDAYCNNTASGSAELRNYAQPTATISGIAVICNGQPASVKVALAGAAPFTFTYTDGSVETTVNTSLTAYSISSTVPKTFSLVSLEDAHCPGIVNGTGVISDGSEMENSEIAADETSCSGEPVALTVEGALENTAVAWATSGKGILEGANQLAVTYKPAEGEAGEVTFTATLSNGCSSKSLTKTVRILGTPNAEFYVSPNDKLLTNTTISFRPANTSYDEYHWDFGDGNTSKDVNASHEYEEGGIYDVTLTVVVSGCENSFTKQCPVYSNDELYVPNAFNPNALNPENRVVKVYGNNVSESDFFFKIVNRWGKVMYETTSFEEANTVGWNGVNNNTDEKLELNAFTYLLRGKFNEGESFQRVGTVTLVK